MPNWYKKRKEKEATMRTRREKKKEAVLLREFYRDKLKREQPGHR